MGVLEGDGVPGSFCQVDHLPEELTMFSFLGDLDLSEYFNLVHDPARALGVRADVEKIGESVPLISPSSSSA